MVIFKYFTIATKAKMKARLVQDVRITSDGHGVSEMAEEDTAGDGNERFMYTTYP